ncbi:MAG: nitrilase [Proteobacteria bacterium]|nr:nitrilase [Pseudomonadota bacterium]
MDDIRVAAVIFNSPLGEVENNLDRMESHILHARHSDVSLICFPEMAVTGYCSDERIKNVALEDADGVILRLQDLAEREKITILTGLAEKDTQGNIYASHFVFIPGKNPEKYRKIHVAPPEQTIFSPGNTIPIFKTQGFCFGIQLCYDAHFPFLSTRMAEKGVDAIFMPHASPRGTSREKFNSWMRHITARSYDNGVFVIACNQCGKNKNGLSFPGLAFVTDPSGEILAKDISGNEGILLADLKKDALDHVRDHRMRYFLPNTRRDLV